MSESRLPDTLLRTLVAGAALVVLVAGLRAAAALLVPLTIATFLALVSHPIVEWLVRHRLPRILATTSALTVLLATLLGPGLVVHGATAQFTALAPAYRLRLAELTLASFAWLRQRGVDTERLTAVIDSGIILDFAGTIFSGLAVVLSNAFLVLLVMAFLLMETGSLGARLRHALPLAADTEARVSRAIHEVYRYLWLKTGISLATGLLVWGWTALLGVDFAVLWGLLAFLLNYIPNFGSIVAAVPAVLVALLQLGPGRAAAVGLGYFVVNVVLGNLVEPYVLGRSLRLSPLVVLVSLTFWGWVWGAVGMVLAVPLTMVVKILLENSRELRWVAILLSDRVAPASERDG